MSNSIQKSRAIKLRLKGKSIRGIAKQIGSPASTISLWCRDIKLTKNQQEILDKNSKNPYYAGRGIYLNKLKKKTASKIDRLRKIGIKRVGKLTRRELFLTGVALYWAEGFKKDVQAGLGSLDPGMIKFYIKWLKVCFGYRNEDLTFRVTANISHKHRIDDIQNYWSKLLGISIDQFRKTFFQNVKWKKTYENENEYFGVLRVKVRKSQDFLREIYGFIEGLKSNSS